MNSYIACIESDQTVLSESKECSVLKLSDGNEIILMPEFSALLRSGVLSTKLLRKILDTEYKGSEIVLEGSIKSQSELS